MYWLSTPKTDLLVDPTVCFLNKLLQPDVLLRLESDRGGNSSIDEDDYIEGAPELIVEIAASSATYDLNDKRNVYCRNGVQEYIVWSIYENRIDWFVLQEGKYAEVQLDEEGIIRSQVFPGLWLSVNGLLNYNRGKLLAVLQAGLATAEHQAFVEFLK